MITRRRSSARSAPRLPTPLPGAAAGEFDGVVIVEQEDGGTLTVADDEQPYPLEMTSADAPGAITFSRFGEKEDITATADALDLSDLMDGA